MKLIDRPFRLTLDFCIVWLAFAVPAFFSARKSEYFSHVYGLLHLYRVTFSLRHFFHLWWPMLLVRQIIRSGSRGWFIARVAITIVLAAALFFFSLHIFGHGKDISPVWPFIVAGVAGVYLHWRTDET